MNKTKRTSLRLLVLWTIMLTACFVWYSHDDHREIQNSALTHARGSFEKDLLYRRWNAELGGVYAVKGKHVPPNPYLLHHAERDIVTTSGKELTLINPAYMTRMMYELGRTGGIYGHITSLNPLRPENRADEWETKALSAFVKGQAEVFSEELLHGEKVLRFMRPLLVEESCLKCHASQGYKLGDIRGGISVAVPMAPYLQAMKRHLYDVGFGIFLVWILGAVGIVSAFHRIAQRETSLQQAAEEWRTTFDSINDFVSVHDLDYRFVRVNRALANFLKKSPEELVGKICYEEMHNMKHPISLCPMEEALQNGGHVTREIVDDGIGMPLMISVSPIHDSQGALSGFVHIARDMTEIKRAQETLEQSETRYRELFEQAPLAYQSLNIDGCLMQVNAAWTALLGYGNEEVVGRSFGDFVTPDFQEIFPERFQHFKDVGEIIGLEFGMIKKDGTHIMVSVNGTIASDLLGNFKQTHCILHNITEAKRQEAELYQYQEKLEQLVAERTKDLEEAHRLLLQEEKLAAIGRLSGSVAHDIRTPLGAISNSIYYLNLISTDETPEAVRKHTAIMDREIKRANEIINDLMDFSRENIPHPVLSDINALILAHLGTLSCPDNITIETTLDQSIASFSFDPSQIQRVIQNISSNALQSMPDGGEMHLSTTRAGKHCQIHITDTGYGISKEDFDKIFEPLFTTKAKGVGLGLSIVKTFVDKHHGAVEIKSQENRGTSVTVSLPI